MRLVPTWRRLLGFGLVSWVGGAAFAGLLLGLALIWVPLGAGANPVPPRVTLYGRELALDAGAAEAALSRVRERVSGWFELELPGGQLRATSYGALGVEIDRRRLRQWLDGAAFRPPLTPRAPEAALELPVPIRLNLARALPTLLALKSELDQAPLEARLDLDGDGVVPERIGRVLDVDRSLRAIEAAVAAGRERAALVFEHREPKRKASELRNIDYATLIGAFDTPYDASSRAADRTFNLRLAASRLDGYVLMPGEEFDFNAVVGPRDEANGYRVAKVIAEGELVDGMGGGTCQISGTLHAAALFAGLRIVERHPHTRPSSYIKLGFDAAVVYPTINLRLANPYDFPVVLRERVEGGRVRAEVRGARRPLAITVVRKIDAARPFAQVERPDETLARGRRRVIEPGMPGFDLHLYRILRDGPHAVREKLVATYPPTTRLIGVGVGPAGDGSGANVTTSDPEYLADELLVMTQSDSGEAAVRRRTPGRYGSSGWTRDLQRGTRESDG